jgi:hypothetical protein
MRAKIIRKNPNAMSGMLIRRLSAAAGALAAAAAAAGCGQATVSPHGRTWHVSLTEYRISPDNIAARPGQYTIVVRNYGRRTHNLVVSLDGTSVARSGPLWPGEQTRIVVTLIPGTYLIASTVLDDQALGDYGQLVVRR